VTTQLQFIIIIIIIIIILTDISVAFLSPSRKHDKTAL